MLPQHVKVPGVCLHYVMLILFSSSPKSAPNLNCKWNKNAFAPRTCGVALKQLCVINPSLEKYSLQRKHPTGNGAFACLGTGCTRGTVHVPFSLDCCQHQNLTPQNAIDKCKNPRDTYMMFLIKVAVIHTWATVQYVDDVTLPFSAWPPQPPPERKQRKLEKLIVMRLHVYYTELNILYIWAYTSVSGDGQTLSLTRAEMWWCGCLHVPTRRWWLNL